ncbi:MAG: hypothetical protein JWO63_2949 [Frankiales bacterium]|nr:hypothetical protein [Frankiales bacterium]
MKWFYRQDLREYPFLLVLVIEVLALGYASAAPEHWLRAVTAMSVGLVIAGLFRLALSNEQAGLLRVRRRLVDTACYWGFGAAAFGFALALPQR